MRVLEQLYNTERAGLLRLAVLLTGSKSEAEEVVHDAFLAVGDRVEELERPGALDVLNERQRAVVVLRYFLDLPDTEIAELLDIAPATVRTVARRSLTRLRDHLTADEREEQ